MITPNNSVHKMSYDHQPHLQLHRLSFLAVGLAILFVGGCSDAVPSAQEVAARRHLQFGEPEKALDMLGTIEGRLGSEARYLRALSLERLDRRDAALSEIAIALESEPKNPTYIGFQHRIRLFQGEIERADEIIGIYDENSASGTCSMFAVYAFEAKAAHLLKKGKRRAARNHRDEAIKAIKNSARLVDDATEYHREILEFTVQYGLTTEAKSLVDKLTQLDPNNHEVARYRVRVFFITKQVDDAVDSAAAYYKKEGRVEEAALLYATVLSQAKADKKRDRVFKDLMKAHSRNADILSHYSVYLARSARLREACEVIIQTAKATKDATQQMQLINRSIALPLEMGAADQAERQLNQFRNSIPSLPLINYYEGRILYLRRQHEAAIKKLVKVAEGERNDPNGSRVLQKEALTWIQTIRDEMVAIKLLQTAVKDKNKPLPKKVAPNETAAPSNKPDLQSPE